MTSEKLKPTPGPWCVSSTNQYQYKVASITSSTGIYADTVPTPNSIMSDATLIAEAGTVFHECGLSPRELLEVVRDIRSLLEQSTAHIKELCMCYSHPLPEATMGEIYDALAKHKEV